MRDNVNRYSWMHHHPLNGFPETSDFITNSQPIPDDNALVARVLRAFRSTEPNQYYPDDSMWKGFFNEKQGEIVQILSTGSFEEAASIIRSPHLNYLYYGFEDLHADSYAGYQNSGHRQAYAMRCKDLLVRLAEGLGVIAVENPEGGPWDNNMGIPADEIVEAIEQYVGSPMLSPPIHYGYCGLKTSRGVLSDRIINGYYCAFRVKQLTAGTEHPRVLEIGGGLGHVAHYAFLMGCPDFTIVDLPLTNLCQGYFLLRVLGPDNVVLYGEDSKDAPKAVHVLPVTELAKLKPVDLAINVDGLTEYGERVASSYFEQLSKLTPQFLSVNHEGNSYRHRDFAVSHPAVRRFARFPYWIRNGYVEEIIDFIS